MVKCKREEALIARNMDLDLEVNAKSVSLQRMDKVDLDHDENQNEQIVGGPLGGLLIFTLHVGTM